MTLSSAAQYYEKLVMAFGANLSEWPQPNRDAAGYWPFSIHRRPEKQIAAAIGFGVDQGFRDRFWSLNPAHPQQGSHPEFLWQRWCNALQVEHEMAGDIQSDMDRRLAEVAREAKAAKGLIDLLKRIHERLMEEQQSLVDSHTQPVGDEATLSDDARTDLVRLRQLIADVEDKIENPSEDMLAGGAAAAVRDLLRDADVPQAAYIDDHVCNALAQRDHARKAIVDIWEAVHSTKENPQTAVRRIVRGLIEWEGEANAA